MPDFDVRERRFEQDIETSLLTLGGFQKGFEFARTDERLLKQVGILYGDSGLISNDQAGIA